MEQSIGVLGKSTPDNLVLEPQQVAFKGLNRRTKEEETRRAAVSKVGHRNLQKVGQLASHSVLCAVKDEFCMIGPSNSVQ